MPEHLVLQMPLAVFQSQVMLGVGPPVLVFVTSVCTQPRPAHTGCSRSEGVCEALEIKEVCQATSGLVWAGKLSQ